MTDHFNPQNNAAQDVLLVKYGEIALRGKNRKIYEDMLLEAIKKKLGGRFHVVKEQGRFVVESADGASFDSQKTGEAVSKIFGVISVCPCLATEDKTLDNLKKLCLGHMNQYHQGALSFKVDTRRADKHYPIPSMDVNAAIGEYILENRDNLKVKVENPDVLLKVELRTKAYLYSHSIKGLGGLPPGSSGKGVLLLSGGIDSPVAGFMAARRGIDITALYFHSPPYTSQRAKEKVTDLAEVLAGYTGKFRLLVVPFTDVQLRICERVPPEKTTIFLKRAMLHAARIYAERNKALCIITGDSVGQVASQTAHSIRAVNSAAGEIPVLRPLACLDKHEITERGEQIGTYEISIRPYDDCCTLFLPKHPETKPNAGVIEKMEGRIPELGDMLRDALDKAEKFEY